MIDSLIMELKGMLAKYEIDEMIEDLDNYISTGYVFDAYYIQDIDDARKALKILQKLKEIREIMKEVSK